MAAGLGYIEFTTGDILTAASANGYLASQTVMVFANSAARTTAITSPQEGMISYLKDTDAVEKYNGSAWVAISGGSTSGLTLITNQTFSSSSAVNVNDVFSSTYRNYRVVMEITSANPTPGSNGVNMRMRVSGTDNSSANYFSDRVFGQNTSVGSQGNTSAATNFPAVLEYEVGTANGVYDVIAPFESANTAITGLNQFRYTSFYQHTTMLTGQMTVSTSYTGFSLIPASGTITGRVLVYGYAN
jgi:hypothetical protein